MKIGILTFHGSINEGAVMQCYSLCHRLMHDFPDAKIEVIDYHMPRIQKVYEISIMNYLSSRGIRSRFRKVLHLILAPSLIKQMKSRKSAFEMCTDLLPLSPETIVDDGTEELFNYINNHYDIVVSGSDAIWNYNVRGFPNPYFLSESIHIPKLSYAASCYGMAYEKIPEEEKKQISKILSSYCFLGVRDDESAKFAQSIGCSVVTVHTCDPTVFLDLNDLPVNIEKLREKMKKRGFDFHKPAIGVMSGNKMCKMARQLYGSAYQIVALQAPSIYADVNLHDLSPYEWSRIFSFFKLTITSFFHGTLVSLRNGVPVIAIALESEYSKNHMTKVQDFLHRVGLEDCYVHTDFKKAGLSAIKQKADQLLNSEDMREIILKRMEREAQSVAVFTQEIERLRQEMEDSYDY